MEDKWIVVGAAALLVIVYGFGIWVVARDKRDGKETNNDFGM